MKNRDFFPLILVVASLAFGPPSDNGVSPPPAGSPGKTILANVEEYVYEVRWSVFKLGTIRLATYPDLHAEAYVDTYEGLPIVDLHAIQFCTMDSLLYSRGSRSLEKKDGVWWGLEYEYDFTNKRILVDETYQNQPTSSPTSRSRKDTLRLNDMHFIDGLSIGIFPRRFVHTSQTVVVPTILNGKLGNTTYLFTREAVEQEIDALDRPVRVVKVEANTDVQGLFGMSGDFVGYFSDDSLSVPIKGTVEVLLGNVNIELIKWNRKGWSPPTR